MNKKLFFVCIASLMLAACSEKLEQAESAKIDATSTDTEQVETEKDDTVSNSEQVESKETTSTLDNVEATETVKEVETTETNIDDSNEDEKVTETVQTSLQSVDKDIDYYDYYETIAVVKNEEEANPESTTVKNGQEAIIYEQLSEDVMQLPLLQDNEAYFDQHNVETITLVELEAIDAVEYYEEPLTRGYLIDINLSILKEHYLGHSYSFEYAGTEYGMMIDEAEKEYGFIFLKDVEGLLEDIKKSGTFNILN